MKSGPFLHNNIIFLACIFLTSVFFSCADTDPAIASVKGYVIFDYENETKKPLVKLAAFIETESDVRRVERINLKCLENNYSWTCSDPLIFSNDSKQWAGFTEFYLPGDENFRNGAYLMECDDAQEKSVSSSFSISYPEENLVKHLSEITEEAKENSREEICVYDSAGTVLYYGMRRTSWKQDSNIFNSIKNSAYYRISYVSNNDAVIYMLPAVYKNQQK